MRFIRWSLIILAFYGSAKAQVSADSLMKHVKEWSSAKYAGRLPGTPEYFEAASYGIGYFSSLGLVPWGESDCFLQYFSIDGNVINDAVFEMESENDMQPLILGNDFSVRGYSGSADITEEVVFCGYGEDTLGFNDYGGVNVAGKIVMIFKANAPYIKNLTAMSIRRKADIAYRHGAKGVIFVTQPNQAHPQEPIGSTMHGEGPMHADLPQIQVSVEVADRILMKSMKTLSSLQNELDQNFNFSSFNTGVQVHIRVDAKYTAETRTFNVIGLLPGNDPALKNEFVIIGAHLDHVGAIGNKLLYPGANDNASGSAALIELARLFSLNRDSLKRSVVFVLYACEEKGLVGADFMAAHLPVSKDKIVAVLNMDCIGYGDSIQVGNGKSCPQLWQMAKVQDKLSSKRMVDKTWKGGGADLTAFSKLGIPGLYFVTTNSYDHLHLPSDKPETLNVELFSSVVSLAWRVGWQIAIGNYIREVPEP